MIFRTLYENETESALALAWKVFLEFEAPDYSEQGVAEFEKTIHDPDFIRKLRLYGAFAGDEMVGVIATRSEGDHVALFFVEAKMQRKGIGRKLFALAARDNASGRMTVHASPYAVPIYQHLGFRETDAEQITNGIRYTMMECKCGMTE